MCIRTSNWHLLRYEVDLKLKASSHAVEHGDMSAVREFNINESMVRKWKKQEHDLLQVKKTKQFPSEQSEMATIMVQIK